MSNYIDLSMKSELGKDVIQYAEAHKQNDIAEYLKQIDIPQ